jgi:carboxylesterase type B
LIPGGQQKEYQTRWIAFANNLDPNYSGLSQWPTYDKGAQNLIIDKHGAAGVASDDFRSDAIEFYLSNLDALTFISQ